MANVSGCRGTGGNFEGGVVVAYRILKHFDIRRSYNRTTGEDEHAGRSGEQGRRGGHLKLIRLPTVDDFCRWAVGRW